MSYKKRLLTFMTIDFILLFAAFLGAFVLRFEGDVPNRYVESFKDLSIPMTILNLAFLYFTGFYKKIWQYAGIAELVCLIESMTLATLVGATINEFILQYPVPFTVYLMTWGLKILLIGGSRFLTRIYSDKIIKRQPYHKHALIVGAGVAGGIVVKEMLNSKQSDLYPIGFVDDDQGKQRLEAHGFPVLGQTEDIPELVKKHNVQEIIVAIPSAEKEELKKILALCKKTGIKSKILPGVYDLISGNVKVEKIREVEVEDLLGRDPVEMDLAEIAGYLKQQTVLVTGAGGSIGSELCRQVSRFEPKKLILLGHGENSIHEIELELRDKFPMLDLVTEITDIKDRLKINYVFAKHKPDVVFHAAAHKHVPLVERNPDEGVKNNVLGTKNLAEASDRVGVKTFVLISTDKAVNPTSVMGATKRAAEMVIQSMNKISQTKFVAVRFGNVLGSRGSVIPIFKKQIAKGGPLTVTHPDMVRFFMTIPEAVQLVIQAGAMANGGEIFVLDMGQPVKILDLAKDLIRLSGYEPNKDIEIKFSGIRPGEKLYEELLTAEEGTTHTRHERIFVAKPIDIAEQDVLDFTEKMRRQPFDQDPTEVVTELKRLIPTFKPQNELYRDKAAL